MTEVVPIETPTLGDRSYLVHDGDVALVIDPQRDIDRVTALAAGKGVRITHVAETHMHNDYVTGGLALCRETGASYLVNAADPVRFDRTPVGDGDSVRDRQRDAGAGDGHTRAHLQPPVLRAGGRRGGRGRVYRRFAAVWLDRPDRPARPGQHRARSPTRSTPPPGGWPASCQTGPRSSRPMGSAVSARPRKRAAASSTIGREKRINPVLTLDERAYVETLLAGLDAWPAYYAHMGPANTAGPGGTDLSPPAGRRGGGTPAHRGRRVGRGPARPASLSRPGSCPARSASRSMAASPPTWAGRSRGAPR